MTFRQPDGSKASGRIDLYKPRLLRFGGQAELPAGSGEGGSPAGRPAYRGRTRQFAQRGRAPGVARLGCADDGARRQAEDYAKALPTSEGCTHLLVVCDVGHCFEIYADFSGQGKNFAQFPDRQGYRIFLEDLRGEKIRERLRLIWLDPHKLDPTKVRGRGNRRSLNG